MPLAYKRLTQMEPTNSAPNSLQHPDRGSGSCSLGGSFLHSEDKKNPIRILNQVEEDEDSVKIVDQRIYFG